MRYWFRNGFWGALILVFFLAAYLGSLWSQTRQVRLHNEHLLRAVERKDWTRFAEFIDADYRDQWTNDRSRLVERTREVFRYLRNSRFNSSNPVVWIENERGHWQGQIRIDGDNGEAMAMVKERVNAVDTPFDFEWRKVSRKPWDWKLVRVSNPGLVLPELAD